ncbi:hypothetical protein QYM36_017219 [Artemia franciscana]|uniref:Uncharacterized protein n=1 Tax=Artemia franciscana TaxID=6661 RepID=A0AA88L292_ARTSF|nr:hypothetical protein QYM36_017219 [Artemia franciscana]
MQEFELGLPPGSRAEVQSSCLSKAHLRIPQLRSLKLQEFGHITQPYSLFHISYPLTLLTSNKLDLQPKKPLRNLQQQKKTKWETLRLAHLLKKKIATLVVNRGENVIASSPIIGFNGTLAKEVQFNMDNKATPGCSWMTTDMNNSSCAFIVSPEN